MKTKLTAAFSALALAALLAGGCAKDKATCCESEKACTDKAASCEKSCTGTKASCPAEKKAPAAQ